MKAPRGWTFLPGHSAPGCICFSCSASYQWSSTGVVCSSQNTEQSLEAMLVVTTRGAGAGGRLAGETRVTASRSVVHATP